MLLKKANIKRNQTIDNLIKSLIGHINITSNNNLNLFNINLNANTANNTNFEKIFTSLLKVIKTDDIRFYKNKFRYIIKLVFLKKLFSMCKFYMFFIKFINIVLYIIN